MVLTHLIQFKFVHGATVNEVVVAPTFGGFHPIGPYAFLGGFTVGDAPDIPTGQNDIPRRGGGSGFWLPSELQEKDMLLRAQQLRDDEELLVLIAAVLPILNKGTNQ